MTEDRSRSTVPVARAGAIAREILRVDGPCEVIAVFERSFYLACPVGIVCIGRDIGAGPINIELVRTVRASTAPSGDSDAGWPALNVSVGLEGTIVSSVVNLSAAVGMSLDHAVEWQPQAPPPFVAKQARRGTDHLRAAARHTAPSGGLARLVLCDDRSDATARAARGAVDVLRSALPSSIAAGRLDAGAMRAATLLLGMGPGLTPSGDDLLGGVMLALTAGGYQSLRDALWHVLEAELDALTVPISAMHLSAAADGMAIETLHHVLDAVLRGEGLAIDAALAAVGGIGHTSGWDAAAGIVLGLDAMVAAVGYE